MSKGIDIRQSGSALLIRALLLDADGAKITSGTASLRLWELQSDGTLHTFDFDDNTFKSGAVTTEAAQLSHQQAESGTYDTGIWTYVQTSVGGFTAGSIIIAEVHHEDASPPTQTREIQYGGAEGDLTVTAGNVLADARAISGDTDAAANLAAIANRHGTAVYVGHTGNDATSGMALKAAIEGASAGTTVFVGPGTFDIGENQIYIEVDPVPIRGAGMQATRITTPTDLTVFADGETTQSVYLRDLSAISAEDRAVIAGPRSDIIGCYLYGQQDAIWIGASESANDVTRICDSIIESPFDAFIGYGGAGMIYCERTVFVSRDSGVQVGFSRPFQLRGHCVAVGCKFLQLNPNVMNPSGSYAIVVHENATLDLIDCSIHSLGNDIQIKNGGRVRVYNTHYDPSKVILEGDGSIEQIDTPGAQLATTQPAYAPSKAGDAMTLEAGTIDSIRDGLSTFDGDLSSITSAISGLQSHGDGAWATATGFATSSQLSDIADGRTLADLATSEQVTQITDKLPSSEYLAGSDSEDGAVATDASLTITPYQVNASNPRYSTRDLPPIAQGSEPTEVWTITNSEGAAVDLSGKTIRVVVCAVDRGALDANSQPFDDTLTGSFKYETGDGITIQGDDNNQVWLDHDASKTATPGVYRYFLWNVTDKLLLAKGRMPIEPAKMDLA